MIIIKNVWNTTGVSFVKNMNDVLKIVAVCPQILLTPLEVKAQSKFAI